MGQGDVLLAGGVVDQHGVALAEGAPAGVLPGQADVDALVQQRPDGQRLGQRPVDLSAGDQLVALGELALQLGVDREPSGTVRTTEARACSTSGGTPVSAGDGTSAGAGLGRRKLGRGQRGLAADLVEDRLEPALKSSRAASASSA